MPPEFTREITFSPSYDKRNSDSSKNYGIGSVSMRWYLKGPKGVIQFVVITGWYLPHIKEELERPPYYDHVQCDYPMATDIGYHSPVPMYEGQEPVHFNCKLLGGPCYYDGSSLLAEPVLELLIKEGSEAVWKEMERRYNLIFNPAPEEP